MNRLLAPLVPFYGGAVDLKNLAFDKGWRKAERLKWPVVSIGNLSVGGSGKTPFVECLAGLLLTRGFHVDVLSRGYGRSGKTVERVNPEGDAQTFGDEPLLLARHGLPVYVGRRRVDAGKLAEAEFQPQAGQPCVHLLDDGFQHRQLARQVDVVLLHRSDFSTRLLPAGRLREPPYALQRASFIVVRAEDAELEREVRWRSAAAPVWRVEREIEVPQVEGETVAFCGIARPEEFFAMLRGKGIAIRQTIAFRDHHVWSDGDVERIFRAAAGAGAILTTEKDLVRLTAAQRQQLARAAALLAVPLRMRLVDEAAAMRQLFAALGHEWL